MGAELLLLIAGLAGFGWLARRVTTLEREIERLHDRLDDGERYAEPAPAPVRPAAQVVRAPARVIASPRPEALEPAWVDDAPEPEPERATFESLAGGKLPIWIGGAALVVAGFFLVRYSIESGLLGPATRVALAALFSLALVAASEVARRLPATRDDPRIGQVLAGAGTASAYGTLYVAVAQYHLVGAVAGFALMVAITAAALFLALRHGPPTAIMALIGGFAAPLVAGFDAAGIGPLLAYLALFIAALFALAARRGWSWLALAALVAGFGWANLIVVLLDGRDTAGVAAFVVALAIGATLALPATGTTRGWLRAAPMVAGLAQLLVLAPTLDFGGIAWSFHLVLAAAALVLAWRDRALMPAALAAAALVTVLVGAALLAPERAATPLAAVVATLMFGGAGLALSRRADGWSIVALVGIAGPVLAAHAAAPDLAPKPLWTLLELAAAAAAALLAWRHRDRIDARDPGLVGGTAAAALLAAIGLASLAGPDWAPAALIPVILATGGWASRVDDPLLARLPAVALAAALLLAAEPVAWLTSAMLESVAGDRLPYPELPAFAVVARMIALPALAGAALLALPHGYGTARRSVMIALSVIAVAILYLAAKQPLAIGDGVRFTAWGFVERAAITLLFALAGWSLARRTRFTRTGHALAAVALARFVWFDLLLLNPVLVAQHVGPLPLANLAVLLPVALALVAATIASTRGWRLAALGLTLVAVAAAIRQLAQGTILTGVLGSGETWGYSAALLLLAVAWLWRGLATHARDLRIAGLALLTLVTLKVFLIDVAALGGLLRIVSFMGLGVALIGIGWAYGRIVARPRTEPVAEDTG